ncbi:putative receptor protein kinase ZmPK1 [Dichanthelium oligosanthes]|uniref:Receptor-like serine/threonine-protein kinase n=1 Tax=Dichanthelium oligosanthes TaxID=888268 RepID=A0A1E5V139_9POAL|nr:putative receptor protein kinase ZmPK1 [Dichanthelium oligosanthes]
MAPFFSFLPILSLLPLLSSAASPDILPRRSSLSIDKYQTDVLRSPNGTFTCGFYSIYDNAFTFSIWYPNSVDKTVVWTANRDRPVHASGAAVTLRKGGALVLTDYDGEVVWQTEGNLEGVQYAQLLDTGNLVMKNSSGMVVWQSFDSPTDTLLPTQHISASTKLVSTTGLHVPGHYIFHFTDSSILSLIYDDANVHEIYWPDPDNGEYQNNRNRYNSTRLAGLDERGNFFSSDFANQQAIVASDEGHGIKRRLTLDPDGNLRLYSLNNSDGRWSVSWIAVSQPCNIHGLCGPNGICHYLPTPTCSCPPGYVMSNPGNWSQGCRAVVDIACTVEQAQPVKFLRLPGTDFWGSDQQHVEHISLQACRNICRSDCTCKGFQYQQGSGTCYPKAFLYNGKAYTSPTKSTRMMYLKLPVGVNISGTPIPQTNVLISRKQHPDCGQMSVSTMEPFPDVHKTNQGESKWFYFYGFAGAIFVLEVFFIASAWCFVLRWELGASEIQAVEKGYKMMTSNFRRYSYKELVKATRKFKDELGRGGSGIVYKGILDDSRAVAVKMLENVRQCEEEFQAELSIIGRINHMNLVRIWGFCSESSHRMLVTEYIESGSLANILFKDNILLEWRQRFNIALGVAKGLAYLHHECLEWVIHCDVKPENILLDRNLEPKIADFGLAKLLNRGGSNQNVSRVRGTIGYIAPEWISSLQITARVDVYSYGVVLLELVLGQRVLDLAIGADEVHKVLRKLVGMLALMLDKQESSSIAEVVDCRLNGQFNCMQVRTLIKLAVSCLDEDGSKRPTMESIVQTLLLADESCSMR